MAHCHISIQKFVRVLMNCFQANKLDMQDLLHGPCISQT